MVKIIVAGAAGRMGRAVLKAASHDAEIKIAGAFERADSPFLGRDVGELIGEKSVDVPVHPDVRECIDAGDVLIDFTQPAATAFHVKSAVQAKCAVVIGTTGLTEETLRKIREAAKKIPIVQSPNMSVGVNVLFRLIRTAAEKLDENFDVEILEHHHRQKKDAPSGTAYELARQIADARGKSLDSAAVYGRKGETAARKPGAIGIHAVRGGDVAGDHTVLFLGEGERLELTHRASSREAFARGALAAAKFVAKKSSGLFTVQDVLGL